MKYYCIHHAPATHRKKNILTLLHNQNIHNIEWIEDFPPEHQDIQNHPKVYVNHAANRQFLNHNELSCFFKHRLAITKSIDINDYFIVFEDDIIEPNFYINDVIPTLIQSMKENSVEILSVGSCCGLGLDLPQIGIITNEYTQMRCTHCYLTHSETSKKLIKSLENIHSPIDWQINTEIKKLNIKSGWSFPYILQKTDTLTEQSLLR
jgi:GR25 family glycosyltransferase involved in LPS biosynthesis